MHLNNANIFCSFGSCLFIQIGTHSYIYLLRLQSAASGILNRCCFYEDSSRWGVFSTGVSPGWCIRSASINMTVCLKCTAGECPWISGSEEFTSFFNNHTHNVATSTRSCYCMHTVPPLRDDNSCFFSGSSCTGPYPVDLASEKNGCFMVKFNFVNNSDSNGYFRIYFSGILTTVKNSVIVFASESPKWIRSAEVGSGIEIRDSFVVAAGPFQTESHAVTNGIQIVDVAQTHHQFRGQPEHKECRHGTPIFTTSPSFLFTEVIRTLSFHLIVQN